MSLSADLETYTESFEELKSYIDQKFAQDDANEIREEVPYSSIQNGAIEQLQTYYEGKGFTFKWTEKDNLFVAIVSKKDK